MLSLAVESAVQWLHLSPPAEVYVLCSRDGKTKTSWTASYRGQLFSQGNTVSSRQHVRTQVLRIITPFSRSILTLAAISKCAKTCSHHFPASILQHLKLIGDLEVFEGFIYTSTTGRCIAANANTAKSHASKWWLYVDQPQGLHTGQD